MITSTIVSSKERINFLPSITTTYINFEKAIYHFFSQLCREYTGGYWEFIELDNGGKFLYPVGDKALKVSNPNNYSAHVMSAKAAGICVTLITLSFYAMKAHERGDDEERDKLATLEYKLYQYARELDEFSSIRSIID